MKRCLLVVALMLAACGKSEPTVEFPRSWCTDNRPGQVRHMHRGAYTTFVHSGTPGHGGTSFPVFHPSRDWDEELVVTTCASQEWRSQ